MVEIAVDRENIFTLFIKSIKILYINLDHIVRIWLLFFFLPICMNSLLLFFFPIKDYPIVGFIPVVISAVFYAVGAGVIVELIKSRYLTKEKFTLLQPISNSWYKLIITGFIIVFISTLVYFVSKYMPAISGLASLINVVVTIFTMFIYQIVQISDKWFIDSYKASVNLVKSNIGVALLYWIINLFLIIIAAVLLKNININLLGTDVIGEIVNSIYRLFQFLFASVLYVNIIKCPKTEKINLIKPVV